MQSRSLAIRKLVMLAFALVLIFVLAACGQSPETAPTQQDAPAATQQTPETADTDDADEEPQASEAVEGAIVWVAPSAPPTLDPIVENDQSTGDVTRQIYEGLMWFGPGNTLQPLLAESYSISSDGLTYTFNLRRGVYFHDGTPFTAEAVYMSFARVLDPENPRPGTFVIEMIDSVEIVDDHTVDITLEFPFAPFLAHLTHQVAFIMSPASMREAEEGGRSVADNPSGTGPFMFHSQVHGDYTRVTPNPNHWRATPAHDVIFRVIPDGSTRMAMINTGEAHVLRGFATDIHQLPMMPHVDWFLNPTTSLTYVGFNAGQDGPLSDVRVRRALTMAINAEDILYGVQEGVGVLGVGPVRPGVVAHAPSDIVGLPFDPDAARELLAEAGFADGLSLNLWTNYGNPVRAIITELIQSNLRDIGVEVSIDIIEWSAYLADTAAGLHDMFVLGWSTLTGDSDYGIYPLFHSSEIGGGNRTHFSNPDVDRLLEAGRVETNPARRDEIYREVVQILVDEAPMLYLFHPDTPIITNGVDGFISDFADSPYFFNAVLR